MKVSHAFPPAPEPVIRCKADEWRLRHGLKVSDMARAIRVAIPDLRRALLPSGHAQWREASLSMRKKVRDYTGGEVGLSDWPERPAGQQNPPLPEPSGGHCPSALSSGADGSFSNMKGAA